MDYTTIKKTSQTTAWKSFVVDVSLVIIVFSLGIFFGLYIRNKQLIHRQIVSQARAHFHSIVLTRRWNAGFEGVYVEKKDGIESNPYLENPDVEARDGRIFTMKNPALMTREISELATFDSLFSFHITSLNPINPGNAPDDFEREALSSFERGEGNEVFGKFSKKDKTCFRYIAPLYTENSCLHCHAKQGYKIGDIRGGISLSFDVSQVEKEMKKTNFILLLLIIVNISSLLSIIYFFVFRLNRKLRKAHSEIERLATTDDLTGLYNRRYFFGQLRDNLNISKRYKHPLGCILLDIDFFKKVNDTFGHDAGDKVLSETAAAIRAACRETDIVGRYGGEEIVVLLPETDGHGSYVVAEKIRVKVEGLQFSSVDGRSFVITISAGVAVLNPEDITDQEDYGQLIKSADIALYHAKEHGRNRVAVFSDIKKGGDDS